MTLSIDPIALAHLDDYSDADLIDAAAMLDADAQRLRNLSLRFSQAVMDRLNTTGAKLAMSDHTLVTLTVPQSYEWALEPLGKALLPHITGTAYRQMVVLIPPSTAPVFKFNTAKILATARKLGPAVEAAVADCYTKTPGTPKLTYSPLAVDTETGEIIDQPDTGDAK